MLKIYLDNCCYNRPFDDQTQAKIIQETNAIIDIINYAKTENIKIYTSSLVEFEMANNKNIAKREKVTLFYNLINNKLTIPFNKSINNRAKELLVNYNIKFKDALHIAYCELEIIDYLLSTDKLFINASNRANLSLNVINPSDFIKEVY
ncbi:MAG: PIN domain-containing protein [Oscillospiraceae bacterium]|nr:PIN domain-containing protein [Oscillospiraceae bacterium]